MRSKICKTEDENKMCCTITHTYFSKNELSCIQGVYIIHLQIHRMFEYSNNGARMKYFLNPIDCIQ